MGTYGNTAITFGSLKSASLYFDYVVPVNLGLEVMPRKGDPVHPGPLGLRPLPNLREVVPRALLDNPAFIKRLGSVNAATANMILKFSAERFGFEPKIQGMSNAEYAAIEDTAVGAFYRFVDEFNLGGLPLDCGGGVPSGGEEPTGESIISLASLDLVDAEQASWDQIIEFRRDEEARAKLRRLRLFAYEKYQGKSLEFVKDDIETKIEDYDAAVKKWGFETAQGAINMLLTSKVIGGALAGSLISTPLGSPTMAVVAAASGSVLEIGHVTVEIAKQRLALKTLMRENPVSFISYAREHLDNAHCGSEP